MIGSSWAGNAAEPLNDGRVLDYLLGRGWVDPEAAVDGDLQVVEGGGRHRHFRIERVNGGASGQLQGLFLKQAKSGAMFIQECLAREAACCRLVDVDPDFDTLKGWVPSLRGYDPVRHVLGMELFQGAPNLSHFHARNGEVAEEPARISGTVLGRQHRDLRFQVGDSRLGALFSGRLPWILGLPESPIQASHPQGPGALYVSNTLRSDPSLRRGFHELAQSYRRSCLIHGDLKWDNILVIEAGEDRDQMSVRFVDWELADIGDPLWDVAGVIQSYWASWLFSMPLDSAASPESMESQARYPLSSIQRVLQAFWTAYDDARDFDEEAGRRELVRALRFSAARLVQTAFETGVAFGRFTPRLAYLLQLSQSTLLHPEQAVTDLLGVTS